MKIKVHFLGVVSLLIVVAGTVSCGKVKEEVSPLAFLYGERDVLIDQVVLKKSPHAPTWGISLPWDENVVLADSEKSVSEMRTAVQKERIDSDGVPHDYPERLSDFQPFGVLVLVSEGAESEIFLWVSKEGYWQATIADSTSSSSTLVRFRPGFERVLRGLHLP